jgi:hypothetical protein
MIHGPHCTPAGENGQWVVVCGEGIQKWGIIWILIDEITRINKNKSAMDKQKNSELTKDMSEAGFEPAPIKTST